MEKLILTGRVEYNSEDGGRALIADVLDCTDGDMFVRLQSWDEEPIKNEDGTEKEDAHGYPLFAHKQARQFEGKKVRVTVEVIDNDKDQTS